MELIFNKTYFTWAARKVSLRKKINLESGS